MVKANQSIFLRPLLKREKNNGKDLEQTCCLLGGSHVESDKGPVGVDRREEGVGATLLAAESLVHPQAQRVEQARQNRRPLCDVLPLCIQFCLIPAVWCQNFNIKGRYRKGLQGLGCLCLQGLAADVLSSKEGEGVDVDPVGLTLGQAAP